MKKEQWYMRSVRFVADVTKARIFIELVPEELKALKAEIKCKRIPSNSMRRDIPVIEIKDPCGSELFFPVG